MSSLWTENIEMPEFPTLEKDIRTQVLIIGGGMAGVLCAYFLQQAGVDLSLIHIYLMRSKIISTAHMTEQLFLSRSKNDKPEFH